MWIYLLIKTTNLPVNLLTKKMNKLLNTIYHERNCKPAAAGHLEKL